MRGGGWALGGEITAGRAGRRFASQSSVRTASTITTTMAHLRTSQKRRESHWEVGRPVRLGVTTTAMVFSICSFRATLSLTLITPPLLAKAVFHQAFASFAASM